MAKRKPTKAKRKELSRKRSDDTLLKRYAHHCYHVARAEKAVEDGLPIQTVVPTEGRRHQAVLADTEAAIRKWFLKMDKGSKARARAKICMEIGGRFKSGYTVNDAFEGIDKTNAPSMPPIPLPEDLSAALAKEAAKLVESIKSGE